ncbi:MAG: response regulator transcription factor, partial [Acidimicrobiia bacterium]|nr:response regulator transcription factor [Acidimicrobiia bacterium]
NVLVVDDSAADRLLMKTLLEQHGFTVQEAPNGAAALKKLEASSGVSVVLLDLLMPEMDGRETLGRLRSSVRTAGIPVVILTASDDPDLELQLLEAGADDYLGKPVDPARLVARVRSVIRRSGWPSESAPA